MRAGGLFALLAGLTVIAGLPLLAPHLAPGIGRICGPDGALLGAAGATILFSLFAWPLLQRERTAADVAGAGLLIALLSLPFVVGLAVARGVESARILAASGVVAGAIAMTGLWLTNRPARHDRWFAAIWIGLVAALPLANYALSDFARSDLTLGYRVSPLLVVRQILLDLPDGDPMPFLLTALAFAAVATAVRFAFRASVVLLLLGLAGTAAAQSVTPIFGDRYLPGRPLPLLVKSAGNERNVEVTVPGRGTVIVPADPAGALVVVPAPDELPTVLVDGKPVPTGLRPVVGSALVAVIGPIPRALHEEAREAGVVLTRADRAEGIDPGLVLAVDAVIAPGLGLPRLRSEGIRRIWQEPGRTLSAEGLFPLFDRAKSPDRTRALRSFVALLLYAVAAGALLRFGSRRGATLLRMGFFLLVPALVAVFVVSHLLSGLSDHGTEHDWISVSGNHGGLTLHRLRALRDTTAEFRPGTFPMVLGREVEGTVHRESGGWWLRLPLRRGEARIVVTEEPRNYGRSEPEIYDLVISADGIGAPGEPPLPAGEYLSAARRRGETWRVNVLRKLLVLDPQDGARYGVVLKEPDFVRVTRFPD